MAQNAQKCACGCGARIEQPARGRRRLYASAACRMRVMRARRWLAQYGVDEIPHE